MGFIGSALGFVGDAVSKVAPLANFIPGIGPLAATGIGIGSNLLGSLNDGGGGGGGQFSPTGTAGGFSAGQTQAGQQGFGPNGFGTPTQQDLSGQSLLFSDASLFGDEARTQQERQQILFDLYVQSLGQNQGGLGGNFSADQVADFGGQVGTALGNTLFRPGGQVEQGFNAGIGENIRSGFGIGGGTSNALLNSFSNANQQITDQAIAQSGIFANALSGFEQEKLRSTVAQQAIQAQQLQGGGANINALLENQFGGDQTALGYLQNQAFDRQSFQQQEEAFPSILKAIQGPSFLERAGERGFQSILNNPGDALNTAKDIFGFGKDLFGFGGGGGSSVGTAPAGYDAQSGGQLGFTPNLPTYNFGPFGSGT